MRKIFNGSLVLFCLCLLTQFAWASKPCPVTSEADGSSDNSTTLRGAVYLLENSTAQCSTDGFTDENYFDQYVYFETTTYSGSVDTIELASAVVFDVANLGDSAHQNSAAVIGNPSSYSLSDATDDVSFDSSGYSDLDSVLVIIHGEAVRGASPFQCSSTSKDVYLRSMVIITDTLTEADFWAAASTGCLQSAGDVHVCTWLNYDATKDPRTETLWCGDAGADDTDFPGDFTGDVPAWYYVTKYPDLDGDGYGDEDSAGLECPRYHIEGNELPGLGLCDGYVTDKTDCDDAVESINPGEREICGNDVDENCDGNAQECLFTKEIFYRDADEDTYGDPSKTKECLVPNISITGPHGGIITPQQPVFCDGYVRDNTDCNDAIFEINPGATEICDLIDNDCDGLIDEGFDVDADGYTICENDCDDTNPATHPGSIEICDGLDNDCNLLVDDGIDCSDDDTIYYPDDDGDGYGDQTDPGSTTNPGGYVEDHTDCNDANSATHPNATEICDGIDNDCDGLIDEGFDVDGDGFTTCENDCDDTNPAIYPGATEICDGIDNNCNLLVDDGIDCSDDDTIYYPDEDDDGYGDQTDPGSTTNPGDYVEDHTDCNDVSAATHPGAVEICDSIDNDCDGQIDEGLDCTTPDDDADDDGYTVDDGDCDDTNAAIHPGAVEICDGIDNDCDGAIDEGGVCGGTDADQDGYTNIDTGGTDCNDNDASIHPGATEICGDGIDQDCNGSDVACEVIVPDPSTDAVVCDVNIDTNADGLPDALDPALTDIDGDGTPDCCTNGNADVILLNYDSDGDGASNCREFALSTDPTLSDLGFQGGAENFGCSLSLTSQTTSGKTDGGVWFLFLSLTAVILFRIRKAPMNLFKPLMVGLGAIAILSFSSPSHALNVQTFAPADAVGSGYGLFTSQTLAPGQFVVGSFFDYAQHPLEIGLTNNNARVFGIVDQFVTADVIATVGLFDHVNLTANMPINIYHNIAPTLIPNRDTGYFDLGDLRLSSKIQLLDADTSAHNWGFALVPFVTAPTGDESVYLGDTGVTGGGTVVAEKKFGPHRLYVNAGAQFKKEETLGNLVVGNAVTYGAGYQHQFSETHAISAIAEVQGSTAMDDLFGQEITTPVGARLILQKDFLEARNLHTYVGGGMGLTSGYGASDFRVYSGISMAFNAPHAKKVEAVKPAENFVGLVYFDNDRDQFTDDNWVAIQDAANFWHAHQGSPVLIAGHADSNWTNEYNIKLSERRALTVLRSLVKLGVPQEQIKVSYYGEDQPVDTNETEAGRRNNRAAKMQIIVGQI